MTQRKKKILVHACCAACASYLCLELEKEDFDVTLFFYNPDMLSSDREVCLNGIKGLSEINHCQLIIPEGLDGKYNDLIAPFVDPKSIKYINDTERLKRRCRELLIGLVMEEVVKAADGANYSYLTSSMLCSPYREHNTVWDTGLRLSEKNKAKFYYKDFRKGYWMGRNYAKKYNLPIPVYCSDYMR